VSVFLLVWLMKREELSVSVGYGRVRTLAMSAWRLGIR
jgi:hypothetical protein